MPPSSPLLLALVLCAGCSFPDVTIVDRPADASTDTGVGDGALDGDAKSDATVEDSEGFDTAPPDTAPEDVFIPPTDAPPDFGPDAKVCDRDGDGYEPLGGTCAPPSGKVDCDDLNPSAHPAIPSGVYFHTDKSPATSPAFDWDCSGVVEKEYTKLATACAGLLAGCVERSGVSVVAACGKPLEIIVCEVDGLGCKEARRSAANQGCR